MAMLNNQMVFIAFYCHMIGGINIQLNPAESSYDLGPSTTFFPPGDQDTFWGDLSARLM